MRLILLLLFIPLFSGAQVKNIFQKEIDLAKYDSAEVIDPTYGIKRYDQYAKPLGGDSARHCSAYSCQGFKEDYYMDGSLLHKGYYENGAVAFFKNYYPGGQLEREYRGIDVFRGKLTTYWPDGKIKSEGTYRDGNTTKYIEYFSNGAVFVSEEMNKGMDYFLHSHTFTEGGAIISKLDLTDPKKLLFTKVEYHENGKVRERGGLWYSRDALDYVKHGTWEEFDLQGNLVSEIKFDRGTVISTKNLNKP